MPVQNSNSKNFRCHDLAIYLLQTLVPATFNSISCQKRQFTLQLCLKRWVVREIFGFTPKKSNWKFFIENFACPKKEVFMKLPVQKTGKRVVAKSLLLILTPRWIPHAQYINWLIRVLAFYFVVASVNTGTGLFCNLLAGDTNIPLNGFYGLQNFPVLSEPPVSSSVDSASEKEPYQEVLRLSTEPMRSFNSPPAAS